MRWPAAVEIEISRLRVGLSIGPAAGPLLPGLTHPTRTEWLLEHCLGNLPPACRLYVYGPRAWEDHAAIKPKLTSLAARALPRLGFLISFPTMIVITSTGGREFAWRDALLNAAVLTALSYGLFIVGLQLSIPLWPARIDRT